MKEIISGIASVEEKDEIIVQYELDACGLFCPEPVMMLHNKIRDMNGGDVVKVIATDPSTQRDIPKFCNFLDHLLLEQDEQEKQFIYWIQKKGGY